MASSEAPTQDPLGDWGKQQSKLVNISELHRRTSLDRATIRERLTAAGITPRKVHKKETFFDEKEAMGVLSAPTAADVTGLKKAQAQKIAVSTARDLLKLQEERGELVPIADMREYAYAFVKAMHGRFGRYAKEAR